MNFLEVKKINKSFGHVSALKNVDFYVGEAEVVGLMGDNGAGKSSLIKIISGVIAPDYGEIYIRNQLMKQWSVPIARRYGIETVYQDQALADQQTITRNIFMGREKIGFLGSIRLRDETAGAERLMRDIGFTSSVFSPDSSITNLSGGERQGVAIARALYFKAQLIILDEPTTALSLTECDKVFRFVDHIKKENSSCIFISHNPYHTYDVADRFVILDRGRIVMSLEKRQTTVDQLVQHLQDIARCGEPSVPPDSEMEHKAL